MSPLAKAPRRKPSVTWGSPPLPVDTAQLLRDLHNAGQPQSHRLNGLIRQLAAAGWPHRSIAAPLGITHQAVSKRLGKPSEPTGLAAVPAAPVYVRLAEQRKQAYEARRAARLIPDDVAALLRDLQTQAFKVAGPTPLDSPHREASVRLSSVMAALNDQGIPYNAIAHAAGVTNRAVLGRLARHGYRKPSPSQAHIIYGAKVHPVAKVAA